MSPARWAFIPLRELVEPGASIIYGILQPGRNIQDGVPYVRPTEIVNDRIHLPALRRTSQVISVRYVRSMLQPDDVILSIVGTIGKVAIVPTGLAGGNITQSSARVRADRRLAVPAYVAAALRSPQVRRQFDNIRLGTAVQRLNLADVRQLEVPLAPLPEQQRIVGALESYFSRLDDAVATLERVQRNLRRYRASVLRAAVEGRLVPTEAELARAEDRDYEPGSVLLERILAERRRRSEAWGRKGRYSDPIASDAGQLPGLPEGWCWTTVNALVWDAGYGTSQKCTHDADGPPVLRIPNVQREAISLEDMKFATTSDGLEPEEAVAPGDLLFIRTNGSPSLIGRGAVVLQPLPSAYYFASYLIRLRIVTLGVLPRWLGLVWHTPVVRNQILAAAASSAGQFNVSMSAATSFVVPIPPLGEQGRILAEIDRATSLIDASEAIAGGSVERCSRLRQAILKWAFEGKLAAQDPNDEPVHVLLARIRVEREAAQGPAKKAVRRNVRARASA